MKIAATIVTFNRLESLKECISIVKGQSRKPELIIVVNNGSTDDTLLWLNTQTDILVVNQENVGSGGGQHTAMKVAYNMGFDWIWTMDDDGMPDVDALKNLVHAIENNPMIKVFNSLVLDIADHNNIAFGYYYNGNFNTRTVGEQIFYYDELINKVGDQTIVEGIPQFFNSSLINRSVMEAVGLPISEFFIRGDEHEYILRIQRAGIKTYTVVNSLMFHPNPVYSKAGFLGIKIDYEELNAFKQYYSLRNRIIIETEYYGLANKIKVKLFTKYLLLSLVNKKEISFSKMVKSLIKIANDAKLFNYKEKLRSSQVLS